VFSVAAWNRRPTEETRAFDCSFQTNTPRAAFLFRVAYYSGRFVMTTLECVLVVGSSVKIVVHYWYCYWNTVINIYRIFLFFQDDG